MIVTISKTVEFPEFEPIKAESEGQERNNLEKAKEIVKEYYSVADHGIFNSLNTIGDVMVTIYKGEGLTIDVCYDYSYFEVFGLSDAEFEELERYYDSLEKSEEV